MSWVAAAAVGGAVVTGYMGQQASEDAAAQQTAAGDRSIAEQRRQYDQTRADNAPFLNTGTSANRRLALLLGLPTTPDQSDPRYKAIYQPMVDQFDQAHRDRFGMSIYDSRADAASRDAQLAQFRDQAGRQFQSQYGDDGSNDPASGSLLRKFGVDDLNSDPIYQSGLKFGLEQGTGAINARATGSGMYDSGATLKALTKFGNDYGSTKANESYNRFTNDQNNTFNRLSGVSGTGQVATGQVNAAGANMANNVSGSIDAAGNARAAGVVGGANAWGGAAGGINNALNNYQSNQTLQALLRRNGTNGAPTSNFDYTGWTAAGGNQYG